MTLTNPSTESAPAPSPALKRVTRGNLCAGCGGCALVAPGKIEMVMMPPGYLRPHQIARLDPHEDAHIARICPGLGQDIDPDGRTDDVLWGPYVSMHTGFSTDPALRHVASSGGALSAVLTHLLDSGAIDAVIQTGAARTYPARTNRAVGIGGDLRIHEPRHIFAT